MLMDGIVKIAIFREGGLTMGYYTLHGRGSGESGGAAWPSHTKHRRQRNNPRGKTTFFSPSQNGWA